MLSGFDTLTKDHLTKLDDEELGSAYVRAKLQASKNHPNDSQDLRKGGVIAFEENEHGLNSGLYIQLYKRHLNPARENMFQLPCYGKKFRKNIHKKKKGRLEVLYSNQKVGKGYVGQFMPKVNTSNQFSFFL